MTGLLISDRPWLVFNGDRILSLVASVNVDEKTVVLQDGSVEKYTHIIVPVPELEKLIVTHQ